MTIQEQITKRLVDNGMFEDQANQVISLLKADKICQDTMQDRWGDNIEGYPPQFLAVMWVTTKRHALAWIDANLPLAWYRPLFE